MWRDRDRYPEHNLVPDTFWLVIAVLLFAACGLVWLIGQVAAILFGATTSTCRSGWSTCSASSCACPAPGTTRPRPGHPPPSRCCPARWACTPPPSSPSGSPPWPTGCWSGWSPPGPPQTTGAGSQVGELVAAAPAAGPGPAAGADHPGPPRPHQRPPPRPAVPGRRAMPLGPGLRPTGVVQDPRAGHPGHPRMAGQPGHHLHQTRRPAGHLRPPGQPGGRLGLRPPRPERRPRGPVDAAGPLPHLQRRPPHRPHARRRRRHRSGHRAEDANYWQLLGAKLLSVLLFAAAGTGRSHGRCGPVGGRPGRRRRRPSADGDRQPAGP